MTRATVSATLIVKNEARYLAACLRSCATVVDEVVVVDTGSTDETREIAAAHGARLGSFAWNGRFDHARNAALDLARGDWILYIDADETVALSDVERFRTVIGDANLIAARCAFFPRVGFSAYQEVRLFRRDSRVRFRGAIHESVTPDINAIVGAGGGRLGEVPLSIQHFGYEGDLHRKHMRNLPLLRVAIKEDPKRLYLHNELARSLRGLGRTAEARAAWLRAVELIRRRRADGEAPTPGESMIYVDLIDLELVEGRVPLALAKEALAHYRDDPQVMWVVGNTLGAAGDAAGSLPLFKAMLKLERFPSSASQVQSYDLRLLTLYPHLGLARAYVALGRHASAAQHLLCAAAADPECAQEHLARAAACQAAAHRYRYEDEAPRRLDL